MSKHITGIHARQLKWKYHCYQILTPCLSSPALLMISIIIRSSQRSHFPSNCQGVFISFHLKQFFGTLLFFMHDLESKQEERTVILENILQSSVVTGSSFQNWVLSMVTQKCCSSLECMASGGSQSWFVPLPVMFHLKLR